MQPLVPRQQQGLPLTAPSRAASPGAQLSPQSQEPPIAPRPVALPASQAAGPPHIQIRNYSTAHYGSRYTFETP